MHVAVDDIIFDKLEGVYIKYKIRVSTASELPD